MAVGIIVTPAYVNQLISAFRTALDGAEVDVEQVRGDRYRFIVVWAGFDPLGHPERQDMVWDLVQKTLDKADVRKVTMVLTVGHDDLPQE